MTVVAASASAMMMVAIFIDGSSGDIQRDALHYIVMITGRIENELESLRRAGAIACARHHGEWTALRRRDHVGPLAKREAPVVLSERGGAPALSPVLRYLDPRNAVAAVPGNTLDFEWLPPGGPHTVGDVGHDRIDDHFGGRRIDVGLLGDESIDDRKLPARNAIRGLDPEALEGLGHSVDRRQLLHPVGRGPSRHDDPRRK